MKGRGLVTAVSAALLAVSPAWGADTCAPPRQAVERLSGYLAYQAAWEQGHRGTEGLTVATVPGAVYFRAGATLQTPSSHFVYIYRDGQRIEKISCPDSASWISCARRATTGSVSGGAPGISPTAASDLSSAVPTCRYLLTVPQWRPTPDGAAKRELAAEILDESRRRGYDPARVIARDFNVDDPELLLYITDIDGQKEMQGCRFNAFGRPHCQWHLFGQAPERGLEDSVMQMPYVILDAAQKSPR